MYGLVNKAIEQMLSSGYGPEAWEATRRHAGIAPTAFVSMQQYDDAITYRLVDGASDTLSMSHGEVLRAFGHYWTLYTGTEGYGDLLEMTGGSLVEFLLNLDAMHGRIGMIYPELRPPSFRCSAIDDEGLLLHYYSEREGLAPMVIGLLEGLAVRFNTPISVEQLQSKADGADHDLFRITYLRGRDASAH
jgi:hypothetical protein